LFFTITGILLGGNRAYGDEEEGQEDATVKWRP